MKLSLDIRTSLTQTLTPQQIQYLKLLQMPLVQLEQQVRQEIEQNPMLEEVNNEAPNDFEENNAGEDFETPVLFPESTTTETEEHFDSQDAEQQTKAMVDDDADPFEFYKLLWQDDSEFTPGSKSQSNDDDDFEPFQIKDTTSFSEDLLQQIRMYHLTEEEYLLAEHIIGNVDPDGYLRRDMAEIVEDANKAIAEENYAMYQEYIGINHNGNGNHNPAREFAPVKNPNSNGNGHSHAFEAPDVMVDEENETQNYLKPVSIVTAEKVLKLIQTLDPPGFASRSIRECLLSQCSAIQKPNAAQKLALEILESQYDAFAMKHYHIIAKQLEVTDDYLREALDVIRKLNPKPGGGDQATGMNTVIPDFIIDRDEETNELLIMVNDSRMPVLRLNQAYEKLKKEARYKLFNKDTREWIRNKYEDAKFLIQAIRQRKNTMLKVMTAIAGLQIDFFDRGPSSIKPLIYKDVSEDTGLDISTVCRIVNGKYVLTQYGTYELKFFFSESLENEDGDEISTTVIKQIIKDICTDEPKGKPYSDDRISKELKKKGYNVARRTVAKYRDQLKIPVARLRREL